MDPLVDTHVHIYDPQALELGWVKHVPLLDRVFSADDYEALARPLGIVGAVYMEVDADPPIHGRELAMIKAEMDRPGCLLKGAVVGGSPSDPAFAGWLDVLAADPRVVGVRQVLHNAGIPPGTCLQPAFIEGVQALGERGLVFDVCIRWDDLGDAVELARACPGTSLVIDHHGNPPVPSGIDEAWRRRLDAVAGEPNTVGKMSGLIQHMENASWDTEMCAPYMEHQLDAFGPDRVVWGSNWPVCTLHGSLERWVAASREVMEARSGEERAAVFHGNAQRIYKVS
ncbi:MAG: amidohydrolase family protein [Phycisphaerales bacterium]|nr:amidohydrolase family protein [Phycisphaerales bacterium]